MIYALIMIAGILLLLAVPFIGAARKGRGRRRSMANFRQAHFTDTTGLGTLASVTAATAALINGVSDSAVVTSVKAAFVWDDATSADGPLIVGFAHSDYSVTQIKEYIESTDGLDWGDKSAQEQANRQIRIAGVLHAPEFVKLAMKKYKLNWLLSDGDAINQFAFNSGAVLTTGSELLCMGTINAFLK